MPPQGTRKAGFARVARLWLQVLFYSVLCGTAAFLKGLEPFSVTSRGKAARSLRCPGKAFLTR